MTLLTELDMKALIRHNKEIEEDMKTIYVRKKQNERRRHMPELSLEKAYPRKTVGDTYG